MSPLAAPPATLDGFPSRLLRPARRLYRIHRRNRGPWWFSHDNSGRFDLAPPSGTCYLAEDPLGAFVEVFREIAQISEATIALRRLSVLRVARTVRLADCTARLARAFGVTAALHSSERYDVTQSWATALARAGYGGVRYRVSHDPAQRSTGIALFGTAGAAPWPVETTTDIGADLLEAARSQFGIHVLPTPPAL